MSRTRAKTFIFLFVSIRLFSILTLKQDQFHLHLLVCKYKKQLCVWDPPSGTYKEFALVDVFAPAVGILHLFAEDKRHLKEKEVALPTLTDQSLWIPDLE